MWFVPINAFTSPYPQLEGDEKNIAAVHTLRAAFIKVPHTTLLVSFCYPFLSSQAERAHPGLSEDFISGVLDAEGVSLNLPEVLLRLACHDVATYTISSEEDEFVILNFRAKGKLATL